MRIKQKQPGNLGFPLGYKPSNWPKNPTEFAPAAFTAGVIPLAEAGLPYVPPHWLGSTDTGRPRTPDGPPYPCVHTHTWYPPSFLLGLRVRATAVRSTLGARPYTVPITYRFSDRPPSTRRVATAPPNRQGSARTKTVSTLRVSTALSRLPGDDFPREGDTPSALHFTTMVHQCE